MTRSETLDDETRILRVKRKRNDDAVDAFLFQFHIQPTSKRRGEHGVFRLKETLDSINSHTLQEKKHVIDAEWDATSHRVKLKRKHEEDGTPTSSGNTRARLEDTTEKGMENFSKLLADYLDLNQVSLEESQEPEPPSPDDYVYDIYYQEYMPKKLLVSMETKESSRNRPPVVGRASSKGNSTNSFSPVPILPNRYVWDHTTSAPGFEHLFQDGKNPMDRDLEWESEASFFPVHLRSSVDADGQISTVAVPIGGHALAEHDLLLEELDDEDIHDEDEDSNDEDYYTNEYPEKDEWDIDSGSESDE